MVQPSLQELHWQLALPSIHLPAVVEQMVGRKECWRVDTAGDIRNGTRKQKVAALKQNKYQINKIQGDYR